MDDFGYWEPTEILIVSGRALEILRRFNLGNYKAEPTSEQNLELEFEKYPFACFACQKTDELLYFGRKFKVCRNCANSALAIYDSNMGQIITSPCVLCDSNIEDKCLIVGNVGICLAHIEFLR